MEPASSLANVQSQAFAEMIAAAVEQGVGRALDSPIRARIVNMPHTQEIAGNVSVSNIGQLAELMVKLINAVYETEAQEKDVQEVHLTNPAEKLEFPDVQKVEVTNPFTLPKEIATKLPPEFLSTLKELVDKIEKKEFSTSVNVDAPDMRPVAAEVAALKTGLADIVQELEAITARTGSLDASTEIIDGLENIRKSLDAIIIPAPQRLPADGYGNLKTVQYNKLIKSEFDSIYATYPDTVTEVYTYKRLGVTVGTVTVVYTTSTKDVITSVVAS